MSARRVLERCDELARSSEEEGKITRWYGSRSLVAAADAVGGWMEEAGLTVRRDSVGNVIGRSGNGGEGTFVLGSHIDTVRDAGRYDGPLGVLLAIEAAAATAGELQFALEVVAFADEEGGRFPLTYLGSRGWAGDLTPEDAALTNALGESLGEAARAMGGDLDAVGTRSAPDDLLGYLEAHIEQGPMLQDEDLPVGIVTAIAAQSRGIADFRGMAGHAGNTPMRLRRDALAGAAEFVLAVERLARENERLTATVGWIENQPNVGNVIAGRTSVTYDVRHQDDATRDRARDELEGAARAIAERRAPRARLAAPRRPPVGTHVAATGGRCSRGPRRTRSSSGAARATMLSRPPRLTSEVAMLFVRCKDGISHHPDESVREDDVAVALDVDRAVPAVLGDPVSTSTRTGKNGHATPAVRNPRRRVRARRRERRSGDRAHLQWHVLGGRTYEEAVLREGGRDLPCLRAEAPPHRPAGHRRAGECDRGDEEGPAADQGETDAVKALTPPTALRAKMRGWVDLHYSRIAKARRGPGLRRKNSTSAP